MKCLLAYRLVFQATTVKFPRQGAQIRTTQMELLNVKQARDYLFKSQNSINNNKLWQNSLFLIVS